MSQSAPYRVLVVDDEEPIRIFVERVLRQLDCDIATAADGVEAMAIARAHAPFDLLVTDLAMPGITGDELARRLRREDPALKILYLTGYSDRLFEGRNVLWEDEAFVDKPVTVQGLLEAVSLLLNERIPPPRAPRVKVPGARVRLANDEAELGTLSATGALLHTSTEHAVDSHVAVVLELPTETVHLRAKVVRCQPVDSTPETTARPPYTVALAFVRPPASVVRTLERVCQSVSDAETTPVAHSSPGNQDTAAPG
jgi:CheY-like chemotaxis protein